MKNVLIIDDDFSSQALLRQALANAGLDNVAVAQDGNAGIKSLIHSAPLPDLIVCDIFMPVKDGIEVVETLSAIGYAGALILVTGQENTMLDIARIIAVKKNLRLLGVLRKPVYGHHIAELLQRE